MAPTSRGVSDAGRPAPWRGSAPRHRFRDVGLRRDPLPVDGPVTRRSPSRPRGSDIKPLTPVNGAGCPSTSSAASMSLLTSTIDVAGRTLPNTSPCARPTSSQRLMSVTNMRVRTTCSGPAPTCCKAATTRRSASRACAPTSSPPTAPPPSAAAVVPATDTHWPARTARGVPDHGLPHCAGTHQLSLLMASSCPVASKELGQVRSTIRLRHSMRRDGC
jgi:hypothetical protein